MIFDTINLTKEFNKEDGKSKLNYVRPVPVDPDRPLDETESLRIRLKSLLAELNEQKERMNDERREHQRQLQRRDTELQLIRDNLAEVERQKSGLKTQVKNLFSEIENFSQDLLTRDQEIRHLKEILNQKAKYAETRQNALESINVRIDSLHEIIGQKNIQISKQEAEIAALKLQARRFA